MNSQAEPKSLETQILCDMEDIPDGTGKGLTLDEVGSPREIFVVREGTIVNAYVNSCPHVGTPLDWVTDKFMDPSGGYIMCATHGALFQIADGTCITGPCAGARLQRLPIVVRDGKIFLAPN